MIRQNLFELMENNPYPGRGIALGLSEDGKSAVIAYFIMGRSENSRNRIFVETEDGIRTEAFDPSKLSDPSLIIYAPVRKIGSRTIVTNGDQTDTVYDYLSIGKGFADALRTRTFEPDAPNYTPRISGLIAAGSGETRYMLSILKSNGGNPESPQRFCFEYPSPQAGEGHLIHTYKGDGSPLPSFEGEPVPVELSGGIDEFTDKLWASLNEDNKVSLYTSYINIQTGEAETRIVNKLQK